jgi:hypothetical protein
MGSTLLWPIWGHRLACAALTLAFVELPGAAVRHLVLPKLIALAGRSPLVPWLGFTQLSAAAFADAMALAFRVVYDAQLFAALDQPHEQDDQAKRSASAIARSSKSATPISGAHLRI